MITCAEATSLAYNQLSLKTRQHYQVLTNDFLHSVRVHANRGKNSVNRGFRGMAWRDYYTYKYLAPLFKELEDKYGFIISPRRYDYRTIKRNRYQYKTYQELPPTENEDSINHEKLGREVYLPKMVKTLVLVKDGRFVESIDISWPKSFDAERNI